ncbi:CBS domain-containing ParB/RepB/Spo0J family partition protein [Methanobacterium alcaliphilum]|uniref:CBS domain-containing ParB/RepB/Spo0J family partition protein n=1 Tax=Methanobacterium alcaliphilum TaxID=392018 RepID=UPI00200B4898|nr:CBS domain-containing protein [Methanobacterium alcaliphilum]MCK9151410.1 CBS domain-containing protein [Methanobacterium alcaliphilum]
MSNKALVKDYMTKDVITVTPDTLNSDIIELMKDSGHDGFPVKENGAVTGMVTAFDFVLKPWSNYVKDIMSSDVVVADQDMSINDAARVMFRMGISRLPVIDKKNHLVGIITNTDIVRSHIERSTPMKVNYFKKTLEQLYNIKTEIKRMKVPTERLRPTQNKVYADELQGRTYELKRGLAEPTIVVKTGERFVLVDGHHRTVAARKLGCKEIDSYVIDLKQDLKLGMEKTADLNGIFTMEDIEIIDDAQHPLIAITRSMRDKKRKKNGR